MRLDLKTFDCSDTMLKCVTFLFKKLKLLKRTRLLLFNYILNTPLDYPPLSIEIRSLVTWSKISCHENGDIFVKCYSKTCESQVLE